MERHSMDLMSLVTGLLFMGLGIAFGLEQISESIDLDPGWVGAVLLVGLGLAGLASVVSRPTPRPLPVQNDDDADGSANGT
jgi:hypothetical protein